MLQIRRSHERGSGDHGWLKSRHSFSFADYYDPRHMGFRSLRVINEDRISGGTGFGSHPHRDMEIISYVVKGALEHKDSMGNIATILPGEVQRMSAGTGIVHSEQNGLKNDETHFFQVWIMPKANGDRPGYGQKSFEDSLRENKLVLVVSGDAREGSISIKQDADIYLSRLAKADTVSFDVRSGRGVWIHLIKGQIDVSGQTLTSGDAIATDTAGALTMTALDQSEFMLFDLGA